MNKAHLLWIIPVSIIIGLVGYSMLSSYEENMIFDNYISCIDELTICKSNFHAYESLLGDCDKCIQRLTNESDTLKVCMTAD